VRKVAETRVFKNAIATDLSRWFHSFVAMGMSIKIHFLPDDIYVKLLVACWFHHTVL